MVVSNVDRIRSVLRQRIVMGELGAGTHLNELTLSREFGVSRVPVREAIRALESEGLVDSKLYSGSRVSDLAAEDAADLFDIREEIERSTARKAARRAPRAGEEADEEWAATRAEITEILAEGDGALAENHTERLVGLNMRFHQAVATLAGSTVLKVLLLTISGSIERLYVADAAQRSRKSWPEHQAIIDAIDAGDDLAAGNAMAGHVRRSKRSYFRGLPKEPEAQ
ncbi:GntR family transcriptional regulator [Leucobacter sp. M11]|uniref:GntR family transcriptional regulator n=1 Tax=Leucobacter sp. M11 TaxID=2993565 RepID=UPI002D7ED9F4|nr:GntR family transcriptional regulator [Leucobacter sp. M11]MEB4613676.1 GntR family transcriptional regulator [Leucobacter sp. M11]